VWLNQLYNIHRTTKYIVKYTTKLKTITFAFTIIVGLFSLVCTCH